jgi:hypothetical protein
VINLTVNFPINQGHGRGPPQFKVLIGWLLVCFSGFIIYEAFQEVDAPNGVVPTSAFASLDQGVTKIVVAGVGRAIFAGTFALNAMERA